MRKNRVNPLPADWSVLRAQVLERAENCCEMCGIANGALYEAERVELITAADVAQLPLLPGDASPPSHTVEFPRLVRVVLAIAHLRHDRTDRDLDYLQALCQRCHLEYDGMDRVHQRRVVARLAGQSYLPGMASEFEPHLFPPEPVEPRRRKRA